MSQSCCWRTVAVLAVFAAVIAVIMGATRSTLPILTTIEDGERIVPRVQIIQFGDSVARFDTTTGELHRFHGDLDRPNVRGQWVRHVRGISDESSGLLQLQKPRGVRSLEALFLVDAVTGDTWRLRERGAAAEWDKVEIVR